MKSRGVIRGIKRVDLTDAQLASSETARAINRDIILELIRTRQPISRAELSRISGLQRSTISSITEQLISENWVREGALAYLPRGRRPTLLEMNENVAALAVDVHPDQASVAVVDLKGAIFSRVQLNVSADPARTIASLIERIKRLIDKHTGKYFVGIGVSLPGRIDPGTKQLIFAPNMHWPEYDIKGRIEEATGFRVELDNAASNCLLSEIWFGRMEGVRNAVLVAVSEGIGTGVFANGQIVSGRNGMAGEFGHIPLDPSGPRCSCGSHGCWESFSSSVAALRYYAEFAPGSARVSYPELLALAEHGDAAAMKALRSQAHYLGRGLRMITASLSPEVILIAGDITSAWHYLGGLLKEELAGQILAGTPPQLIPTPEGDADRLRGAGVLALQRHGSPSRPAVLQRDAVRPGRRTAASALTR